MLKDFLLLFTGISILLVGADLLIRGSTRLAKAFGVPTLIIGLTVVAFGTSAPELFVSGIAAWNGTADVAVGNIIGSNLFNVLVIIGVTALISPIHVSREILFRGMPLMLGALLLFYILGLDSVYSRIEGSLLFTGIVLYLLMNARASKKQRKQTPEEIEGETKEQSSLTLNLLFILLGLAGLVTGSEFIVNGAVSLAKAFHVPDLIIAITLIAAGTSLPELATTIVAATKNEADLAVGNAIGSNVFNVLCVVGITAMITPLAVSSRAIQFDMPWMLVGCALVYPMMWTNKTVGRKEGILMIGVYLTYIILAVQ